MWNDQLPKKKKKSSASLIILNIFHGRFITSFPNIFLVFISRIKIIKFIGNSILKKCKSLRFTHLPQYIHIKHFWRKISRTNIMARLETRLWFLWNAFHYSFAEDKHRNTSISILGNEIKVINLLHYYLTYEFLSRNPICLTCILDIALPLSEKKFHRDRRTIKEFSNILWTINTWLNLMVS